MEKIDEIDTKILHLLQTNGRIKRNQIAEHVGLSVPSVSERMRKLEERGVILGYHAVLDPKRLHRDVTAFVRVLSSGSDHYGQFIETLIGFDEVLELHSSTGDGSHVVKVRVTNTAALEKLLARMQALPGVRGTQTSIVLSTYKETRYLATEPTVLAPAD